MGQKSSGSGEATVDFAKYCANCRFNPANITCHTVAECKTIDMGGWGFAKEDGSCEKFQGAMPMPDIMTERQAQPPAWKG